LGHNTAAAPELYAVNVGEVKGLAMSVLEDNDDGTGRVFGTTNSGCVTD
jgi:hypothetical protein